jgi:hypothetical protein
MVRSNKRWAAAATTAVACSPATRTPTRILGAESPNRAAAAAPAPTRTTTSPAAISTHCQPAGRGHARTPSLCPRSTRHDASCAHRRASRCGRSPTRAWRSSERFGLGPGRPRARRAPWAGARPRLGHPEQIRAQARGARLVSTAAASRAPAASVASAASDLPTRPRPGAGPAACRLSLGTTRQRW